MFFLLLFEFAAFGSLIILTMRSAVLPQSCIIIRHHILSRTLFFVKSIFDFFNKFFQYFSLLSTKKTRDSFQGVGASFFGKNPASNLSKKSLI